MTREDLIFEIWERLDCESIGATELRQIQTAVEDTFGVVDSPASIARTLADNGATLRHPEILELDTEWRAQRLSDFNRLDFSSLSKAIESLRQLEALRQRLESQNSNAELTQLYDFVVQARDELSFTALNKKGDVAGRAEAREIAEWLSLWRNSPDLFPDWLELRLASPGFKSLFPDFQHQRG